MRTFELADSAESSGMLRIDHVGEDGWVELSVARRLPGASRQRLRLPMRLPIGSESFHSPVQAGDVVRLSQGRTRGVVCYRPSDRHHALFVTNQCNSRCLMCSQPPTPQADSWLFDEASDLVALVEEGPGVMGITGGEPTLHPERLRGLLAEVHSAWPQTVVEVLTNGRALGDSVVADQLLGGLPAGARHWLVPLYGASDEVHDFVVQSPGAFDETIAGLLNLQERGQAIQLRIVLIRPVLDRIEELCEFIAHSLPFVQAVALMGAEPIGFALANPELCVVDPLDFEAELTRSVDLLVAHGLKPVLMNVPLCKVQERLRQYAAVSISDWKNEYAPDCHACQLRSKCAGFFVWPGSGVMRVGLRPILGGTHV